MIRYALLSIVAALAAGCASVPYPWVESVGNAVPRSPSPQVRPPLAESDPPRPTAAAGANRTAAPAAHEAAPLYGARDVRVEATLRAALDAYKAFEYEEVVGRAEQVLRDPRADGRDRAEAALLAGAAAFLLDDGQGARACFQSALEHDPRARPNPTMFPQAILECFDGVRSGNHGFRGQDDSNREE